MTHIFIYISNQIEALPPPPSPLCPLLLSFCLHSLIDKILSLTFQAVCGEF